MKALSVAIAIALTALLPKPLRAESDVAAVEFWEKASPRLSAIAPFPRRVERFVTKQVFELNFPHMLCNLRLTQVERIPAITYACPEFYAGEPVQFTFAAKAKPHADEIVLIEVRYPEGPLYDIPLKLFLRDISQKGYGSIQVLMEDAKSWTVDMADGKGGVVSKGALDNLTINLGRVGYDCIIVYQSMPNFVIVCGRVQQPAQTYSKTDRWFFSFKQTAETHIVLTKATSTALNVTADGDKVEALVGNLLEQPEAE